MKARRSPSSSAHQSLAPDPRPAANLPTGDARRVAPQSEESVPAQVEEHSRGRVASGHFFLLFKGVLIRTPTLQFSRGWRAKRIFGRKLALPLNFSSAIHFLWIHLPASFDKDPKISGAVELAFLTDGAAVGVEGVFRDAELSRRAFRIQTRLMQTVDYFLLAGTQQPPTPRQPPQVQQYRGVLQR